MSREIVVAIPTFHRPESLAALLRAVAPQVREVGAEVVVIDNDPAGSARESAAAEGARYVIEPGRGLAAVRNRALDEAAEARALVFIDDDELPADDWLSTLVQRWRHSGAAAVSGRVETRFPDGWSDRWIEQGGFFRRVRFADGAQQHSAPTNNLLLDLEVVRRHGVRFDPAFGLSGGEDIHFTRQLVTLGESIVSAPDALVFDIVDPARLTKRWVLRRAYRVGISTVHADVALRTGVRGRLAARVRGVAKGALRLMAGSGRRALGVVTRSDRHRARGARAAWRGAGMVVGAVGGSYQEYIRR
ncbi:glycosyltransferase family 2 protein [Microbacterium sp. VKM Ac-2870]|uniref:glycosyltransferase family 2 protein n=1 Tax=Microbacterium sp. VKM Ac-2870 TaxID=2783825 RepID=UPI00188C2080|nr:glycosyltransferase family 2 protein [Microbacterium sp. VKM Ac-2870]MBF4562773.1 glycosyltransferase family 2 protein [Microbacterium sp. VKM Ac-2870]